uniref:G-protein coupled receptors family 1 profile domain-containing protein n=1 Tax=Plectus sambesii TaxID=2011161 RepID=A0A914WLE7_9BILA
MGLTDDRPPEPIASDYVELGILVVLFIVGGPLNLAAYTQLSEKPTSTRLDLLKRHLNYSDLLVLFVYAPSRACWLLTYDWRGGDLLCKIVKFLHTVSFQVSSNVIVCIALDRLLSVLSSAHNSPERALKRTKYMLLIAWALAVLISAPQFAVWKTFLAFEEYNWNQCAQIWQIARWNYRPMLLSNDTAGLNGTGVFSYDDSLMDRLSNEEQVYTVIHMLFIFWIPSAIVGLCYLTVSCWVYANSRPSPSRFDSTSGNVSYHTGMETVETLITRAGPADSIKAPSRQTSLLPTEKKRRLFSAIAAQYTSNPKIIIQDENQEAIPFQSNNTSHRPSTTTIETPPMLVNNGTNVHVTQNTRGSNGVCSHTTYMVNSQSYNARLTRSRAIRVSFLLVAAYMICWLPYNGMSLWQFVNPEDFEQHSDKVYCLHGMIVLNSVINPFLYGMFGIKKLFARQPQRINDMD